MRTTLADLAGMKARREPIVMVTAYDFPSARLAERAGADVLLVGDSLGMVVLGHQTTLPVSLNDMIVHAAAVMRGSQDALVVCDLPFMTYATDSDAVAAARRVMQETGVQAIKLEGGAAIAPTVSLLASRGVPVMGHLGFTPQSQHQIGIRVQGKTADEARQLMKDALALQAAGAFAIVLELTPAPLALAVTERLAIPTIGIGAGAGCDGQVQVWHDLLGLSDDKPPRHAKAYARIGDAIETALRTYVADVRSGAFPTAAQGSTMSPIELAKALD